MKKKLLAFVMAATMVFSLAACGSSSSNDSSNSGSSSDSAQSGDEVQTFKLGSIGPLTGDAAIYGQAVVNGAQLAVDEINASDSKIKFEFKGEDDEADGEKSTNAYNQLMDWGMQVLVGPTTTGASMAVADVCNSERTFMITPSASAVDVTAGKDNVFQVCFTDPNQGISSADYIAENMPDAKIAVLYRNDDAYSQGIHDTFVKEATEKGMSVVYEAPSPTIPPPTSLSSSPVPRATAPIWCSCPSTISPLPSFWLRPRPWATLPPSSAWTAWTAS